MTAGYIHPEPRQAFYAKMDAANVDLKGFTEEFYWKVTGAHLQPVLDTLVYLRHQTSVWFEITTLLIPGMNDSDAELTAMCAWIAEHLGDDVPLHFTAFHPDFKMTDVIATPPATLTRARAIAHRAGLKHVYTGNVHDTDGGTTHCGACKSALVVRDWFDIERYRVSPDGSCPDCGARLAGRFENTAGRFGRRRLPLRIAAQ